ncbi:Thiol-specific monooxygenase [Candida viswanathii]|uniref:Thiol-specific monooxygenase n=1 Tax=Candida viswanathii TaxID=5486 RepID=A0A367YHT3_9ASCO|nr:Thiol-specific monooxygenase [Candida viswanathii]
MVSLNVNSIGIIGGGPGGLASLYEFLNTAKDGTSTVGTGTRPTEPAFTKLVVFEQKDAAGGIWGRNGKDADLAVPPQSVLDTQKYGDPFVVKPTNALPDGIESSSRDNPVVTGKDTLQNELEWKRSGVYPFLFTNIPARFTRFSYQPDEEKYHDKSRAIYPFLYHQELEQRFSDFIEREQLAQYIRTNTTVENILKNSQGKWVVSARYKNPESGSNEWYQEEFDALVVANGHYTVPYIPELPGLAEYNAKNPDVLVHAKSFRDIEDYRDKDVLIVGGSISTANIVQYIIPVAKSVTNAKRGKSLVFEFINDALVVPEIDAKGTIDHFDTESGEVHFSDGTHKKFDKIIFTTGYHYHYPFATEYLQLVNPGNLSRVKGLYYDTFYQNDPTLGTVGIAVSHLNFHTIEASAAALAGVWSGAKELPTQQEQELWEKGFVKAKGDSIFFHFYSHHDAGDQFVDKLYAYAPKERYNPLKVEGPLVGEVDEGLEKLAELYYLIKDQKLTIKDTSLPVEA